MAKLIPKSSESYNLQGSITFTHFFQMIPLSESSEKPSKKKLPESI
jgi:hypothetical protein